jgi:hypothetical protein
MAAVPVTATVVAAAPTVAVAAVVLAQPTVAAVMAVAVPLNQRFQTSQVAPSPTNQANRIFKMLVSNFAPGFFVCIFGRSW